MDTNNASQSVPVATIPSTNTSPSSTNSLKNLPLIVCSLICLILGGAGGYYLGLQNKNNLSIDTGENITNTTTNTNIAPTTEPNSNISESTNWNIFTNDQFTFSYPPEFNVEPTFLPNSTYKNSWIIIPLQQTRQDYITGKSINLIIVEKQEFEVSNSNEYQEVVYNKELEINGYKARQQILVGNPTDINAADSTVIITQIKDNSENIIITFSAGLYQFIQDKTNNLSEQDYLNIIQNDLSTYNKVISTIKFVH